MEQSHFVCVTHLAVSPFWQACRNMKNSFNAAPRDERPENGRLAPPAWAEILLADRQNQTQNKEYSTGCPKKMFSLRYNFFLNPRHT
jgi:hypothetical protein